MFARVTQFEIDTMRISLDDALQQFKALVVPAARQRDGYEGMYVMRTTDGKGVIVSFWATEEAAQAGLASGYYAEQVSKFMTVFRSPPGRDHYEVVFHETAHGEKP